MFGIMPQDLHQSDFSVLNFFFRHFLFVGEDTVKRFFILIAISITFLFGNAGSFVMADG